MKFFFRRGSENDVSGSQYLKVANCLGSGTEKMEIDRKNKVLPRANRIIKQSLPLASLSRCGTNSCAGIKTENQQVVVLSDGAIRSSSAFVLLEKRIFARSEEHTSELQSLMRISYAVFCLKKKNN